MKCKKFEWVRVFSITTKSREEINILSTVANVAKLFDNFIINVIDALRPTFFIPMNYVTDKIS